MLLRPDFEVGLNSFIKIVQVLVIFLKAAIECFRKYNELSAVRKRKFYGFLTWTLVRSMSAPRRYGLFAMKAENLKDSLVFK